MTFFHLFAALKGDIIRSNPRGKVGDPELAANFQHLMSDLFTGPNESKSHHHLRSLQGIQHEYSCKSNDDGSQTCTSSAYVEGLGQIVGSETCKDGQCTCYGTINGVQCMSCESYPNSNQTKIDCTNFDPWAISTCSGPGEPACALSMQRCTAEKPTCCSSDESCAYYGYCCRSNGHLCSLDADCCSHRCGDANKYATVERCRAY